MANCYVFRNPERSSGPRRPVKDENDKSHSLIGIHQADRIHLRKDDPQTLHKLLLNNKKLKFYIGSDNSDYTFTIDNTEYYNNAYRILRKGK